MQLIYFLIKEYKNIISILPNGMHYDKIASSFLVLIGFCLNDTKGVSFQISPIEYSLLHYTIMYLCLYSLNTYCDIVNIFLFIIFYDVLILNSSYYIMGSY